MLDVHVLIGGSAPDAWQTQCLQSVRAAIERSPYAVHLQTAPCVPGHIGRARAGGYALGEQPYVTHVDADDWVETHAFACLADALAAGPEALFTRERVWQNGGAVELTRRHHLAVYRRTVLVDHTRWECYGDVAQIHAVRNLHVIDVPALAYNYRVYASGARAMLPDRLDELRRARQ